MADFESTKHNVWNPFIPTERDLKRTEKLAQKNPVVAGVLSLLFLPIGLVYLNRGINSLKIFGYTLAFSIVFSLSASSEEEASGIGKVCGYLAGIATTVEQVRTVTEARKRQEVSV